VTRDQLLQAAVEEYGKARAHEMALWLTRGGRPMAEFLLEAEEALEKVQAARRRIFAIVNNGESTVDGRWSTAEERDNPREGGAPGPTDYRKQAPPVDSGRERRAALRFSDLPRIVSIAEARADDMAGACAPYGVAKDARGSRASAANHETAIDRRSSTVDGATEGSAHGLA